MRPGRTGIEYTAASEAAVRALDAIVEAYCSFGRDIGSRLKAAFEADSRARSVPGLSAARD